jgi:hypothetical protein
LEEGPRAFEVGTMTRKSPGRDHDWMGIFLGRLVTNLDGRIRTLSLMLEEHVLKQSKVEDRDVFLTEFDAKAGPLGRVLQESVVDLTRSDGSPEPEQQQQQ